MLIGRVLYSVKVVVLAFVIAGLLAWLAAESFQLLIGDRHPGPSTQWWQEPQGLNLIAAELIETDSGGTGQLGTTFTQAAREWLSEGFPGVELLEANLEMGRDSAGEAGLWRVSYRLRGAGQSVFHTMFCLDHDSARIECL